MGHFSFSAARRQKGLDMHARAIETRYKGYRFRSRLEARWAVFFDALGLKWEYEPEGFELEGGVRYLPDFRLWGLSKSEDLVVFAEVKPDRRDDSKALLLSKSTGAVVLLLDGAPDNRTYDLLHSGRVAFSGAFHKLLGGKASFNRVDGAVGGTRYNLIQAACEAMLEARSARFEHGESGARK